MDDSLEWNVIESGGNDKNTSNRHTQFVTVLDFVPPNTKFAGAGVCYFTLPPRGGVWFGAPRYTCIYDVSTSTLKIDLLLTPSQGSR